MRRFVFIILLLVTLSACTEAQPQYTDTPALIPLNGTPFPSATLEPSLTTSLTPTATPEGFIEKVYSIPTPIVRTPAETFRITSYNIETGADVIGMNEVWECIERNEEHRLDNVLEVISNINPDIIALQEAACWDWKMRDNIDAPLIAEEVGQRLGMYYSVGPQSYYVTYSKFPIIEAKEYSIPSTGFTFLYTQLLTPIGEVNVLNYHRLQTVGDPDPSASMQALNRAIHNSIDLQYPTILIGDFNLIYYSEETLILRNEGWVLGAHGVILGGVPYYTIDQIWIKSSTEFEFRSRNDLINYALSVNSLLWAASDHPPAIGEIDFFQSTVTQPTFTDVEVTGLKVVKTDSGFRVMGLMENTGETDIKSVTLNVSLVDSNGNNVGSESVEIVLPLNRFPATSKLALNESVQSSISNWEDYELFVTYEQSKGLSLYSDVHCTSAQLVKKSDTSYLVKGEVQNFGRFDTGNVLVVMILYDASGSILGLDNTKVQEPLLPDMATSFARRISVEPGSEVKDFDIMVFALKGY